MILPTWAAGIGAKLAAFGALLLALFVAVLEIFRKGEKSGAQAVEVKQAEAVQNAQTTNARVDAVTKAKTDEQIIAHAEKDWTK